MAATLMQKRIKSASEGRGFAQSRVLTHWPEIVGADIAATTRPVEVSYQRGGLGATLSVLTTGAMAPMIEMQKEKIRDKVNACYGYRAIVQVRITQTAPTGFANGRVSFDHERKKPETVIAPQIREQAQAATGGIDDEGLRKALAALGANVMAKAQKR